MALHSISQIRFAGKSVLKAITLLLVKLNHTVITPIMMKKFKTCVWFYTKFAFMIFIVSSFAGKSLYTVP